VEGEQPELSLKGRFPRKMTENQAQKTKSGNGGSRSHYFPSLEPNFSSLRFVPLKTSIK